MNWLEGRFKKTPELLDANLQALKAGYNFGETTEMFASSYEVPPARIVPGIYRNITGNSATALGFVAAAVKAGRPLFLGSYPITPASDILHELAGYKNFPVYTFQAEDEIAGVGVGDRRRLRRRDRDHDHLRPGHVPEGRGDRPGGEDRAAAGDHRHPARRPVHRAADQDRAGRPAAGDVRPQRRIAGADHRGGHARPIASTAPSKRCGSRSST